ncbi:MAG: phenylacetate-CoA oxygenase subunit PaaJ [Anaerolineales bacterium]|nr:phenylacetate-CoA oxygenase subunit PaaJ [Anaerolineales bacterium]
MSVDPAAVWEALNEVMDPELPVVSVVELGMVRGVTVDGDRVTVALTPTFAGCPAQAVMQAAVAERVRALGPAAVTVTLQLDPPWTTDWIADTAREKLRRVGLATPRPHGGLIQLALDEPAVCPYCGSTQTDLRSAFGPTLCRAIYYCRACRQGFELFKPL